MMPFDPVGAVEKFERAGWLWPYVAILVAVCLIFAVLFWWPLVMLAWRYWIG